MHHLCEDQTCLEKKFIVFPSEQELKQHVAREHGGNMSRAEKRQALTIPVNFQVPCLTVFQGKCFGVRPMGMIRIFGHSMLATVCSGLGLYRSMQAIINMLRPRRGLCCVCSIDGGKSQQAPPGSKAAPQAS